MLLHNATSVCLLLSRSASAAAVQIQKSFFVGYPKLVTSVLNLVESETKYILIDLSHELSGAEKKFCFKFGLFEGETARAVHWR